jgi:hypothetical protein
MLKINLEPTFTNDVEITVPGQPEPGTIPLTFKYRSRKDYVDLIDSFDEKKTKKKPKALHVAFQDFVLGWGLDEEFNPKNIETFLGNYPAAYQEIFTHYSKMLLVSRVKN